MSSAKSVLRRCSPQPPKRSIEPPHKHAAREHHRLLDSRFRSDRKRRRRSSSSIKNQRPACSPSCPNESPQRTPQWKGNARRFSQFPSRLSSSRCFFERLTKHTSGSTNRASEGASKQHCAGGNSSVPTPVGLARHASPTIPTKKKHNKQARRAPSPQKPPRPRKPRRGRWS